MNVAEQDRAMFSILTKGLEHRESVDWKPAVEGHGGGIAFARSTEIASRIVCPPPQRNRRRFLERSLAFSRSYSSSFSFFMIRPK